MVICGPFIFPESNDVMTMPLFRCSLIMLSLGFRDFNPDFGREMRPKQRAPSPSIEIVLEALEGAGCNLESIPLVREMYCRREAQQVTMSHRFPLSQP